MVSSRLFLAPRGPTTARAVKGLFPRDSAGRGLPKICVTLSATLNSLSDKLAFAKHVWSGSFATDALRASADQCPLCPYSDHSRHESELTRSANNRHQVYKRRTFPAGQAR